MSSSARIICRSKRSACSKKKERGCGATQPQHVRILKHPKKLQPLLVAWLLRLGVRPQPPPPARGVAAAAGASHTAALPNPQPLVVSVVTDFEAHALWMDECVDLYCVATEGTKARLAGRGAAAENVVPTGIPIAAKFLSKPDAKAVRKHYGLRDDQPVLLVLGGGFGMGPVAAILNELDKVPG